MKGNLIIKAFTVHSSYDKDADFTYWIVPLHDYEPANGVKFQMQLFHSKEEAERFAEQHRGKNKQ
jgi:hypothetical protein